MQPPLPYWRGRGAGGSSAINGQIAIRGMLSDFDEWTRQGCAGWSGAEVLPYFKKLEDDLDFGIIRGALRPAELRHRLRADCSERQCRSGSRRRFN